MMFATTAVLVVVVAALAMGMPAPTDPECSLRKIVSFGDSLSDVGTYATKGVVGGLYGGKYTVNNYPLFPLSIEFNTAKIWVELLAEKLWLPRVCAARTGLESSGAAAPLAQDIKDNNFCYGYAQGGSRVTNPVGLGNKANLPDPRGLLGALTNPLVEQINRYLSVHKAFKKNDIILIESGGNDLSVGLEQAAIAGFAPAAVAQLFQSIQQVATEYVTYIQKLVLANGATPKNVIVFNIPAASLSPALVNANKTIEGGLRQLSGQAEAAFNQIVAAGLANTGVKLFDVHSLTGAILANPSAFGITNAKDLACGNNVLGGNAFACHAKSFNTTANTVAKDVSGYLFADGAHLAQGGQKALAQQVFKTVLGGQLPECQA